MSKQTGTSSPQPKLPSAASICIKRYCVKLNIRCLRLRSRISSAPEPHAASGTGPEGKPGTPLSWQSAEPGSPGLSAWFTRQALAWFNRRARNWRPALRPPRREHPRSRPVVMSTAHSPTRSPEALNLWGVGADPLGSRTAPPSSERCTPMSTRAKSGTRLRGARGPRPQPRPCRQNVTD